MSGHKIRRITILVVGASGPGCPGVGKTSLIASLSRDALLYEKCYQRTSLDFVEMNPLDATLLHGPEKALREFHKSIRASRVIILVYSVTDEHSFNEISNWVFEARVNPHIELIIVGNKSDEPPCLRKINPSEGEKKAVLSKAWFTEMSAKSGHNLPVSEVAALRPSFPVFIFLVKIFQKIVARYVSNSREEEGPTSVFTQTESVPQTTASEVQTESPSLGSVAASFLSPRFSMASRRVTYKRIAICLLSATGVYFFGAIAMAIFQFLTRKLIYPQQDIHVHYFGCIFIVYFQLMLMFAVGSVARS